MDIKILESFHQQPSSPCLRVNSRRGGEAVEVALILANISRKSGAQLFAAEWVVIAPPQPRGGEDSLHNSGAPTVMLKESGKGVSQKVSFSGQVAKSETELGEELRPSKLFSSQFPGAFQRLQIFVVSPYFEGSVGPLKWKRQVLWKLPLSPKEASCVQHPKTFLTSKRMGEDIHPPHIGGGQHP